ncbi:MULTISPECIES: carbohydrate ABC transporter permease [Enterococcus]|uniref:Multiple sugar transport system permease n=1 Tax=Candidatus Enterococcus ferrettii TaxID=2815324 RepID=A0ABV0ER65_9ENTE|nr:sugar ABC transporter permease [Enterococcus sp. 665A]MBO1339841.1 sugar ABC transporter permease [Enterococcus sp. 665A]
METKKKLDSKKNSKQEFRFSLLMLLPALLFLFVLIGYPLGKVIYDSFFNVHLINDEISGFAYFDNFSKVMRDERFLPALINTCIWTIASVCGEYIIGLGSAILLNKKFYGRTFFRIATFIPWLVPIIVAGMTWSWMLNPDYGIVNYALSKIGIIESPINFLGDPKYALGTVIFVNIWRSFPYFTISFLAALQTIPESLYEAVSIDGGGKVRQFLHVTLPQLKSTSIIIIFMHLIWTAINFDFIWVMTQGGPNYATQTLPLLIYRYSMQKFDVGAASALSTLLMISMTICFVIYLKIKNKSDDNA